LDIILGIVTVQHFPHSEVVNVSLISQKFDVMKTKSQMLFWFEDGLKCP